MLKNLWKAGVVIIGALLGYSYFCLIGCKTGTCPITSNPWISTGYGALFGLTLVLGGKKRRVNRIEESK